MSLCLLRTLLFSMFCWSATLLSAQQWDTLAPVPEDLTFPVVAVLNGKIHVMGGGGSGGASQSHYAYDPATNTWESRAPVPYKAQQPAGAAVDGKIHYFGGGFPNSGTPLNDHYVYDPATDSWDPAADLTAPRAIHYAVGLGDTLFSLGGQGMANLCQTYDALTDTWTTKNNLPDNSFWYGAHVATGGHIYRFCGGGYTAPVNKAHRYNPASDTWTPLPNMPNAIHGLKGAAIGDRIFLAGGYFNFLDRDEVWIFDTNTNTYTPGTPLPLGRSYLNVVAIDSCIYSVGGNNAIDETVGVSLLRLCPYAVVSGVQDNGPAATVTARYHAGILTLQLPETISGGAELTLFDLSGRVVFAEQMPAGAGPVFETRPGDLAAAVYFVRVRTGKGILTGKLSVL